MRKIYAADMGAGNTNIYCIVPSGTDPSSMTAPDGEPSGYVVYNDNTMDVGKSGIYGVQYSDLLRIQKFKLNWKKMPTEENRAELTEYFRAWNKRLRSKRAQDFDGVDKEIWFVGCPTGGKWKRRSVRNLYKEILEDAGFKNVTIIPESNGGLAYYQKEKKILDDLQANTKVILFDLGAYSIDATSFNGNELTSYGQYLGAGLIDKMIVRTILYKDEANYRVGKKIINDPDTVKEARKEYEHSDPEVREKFRDFLRIGARQIKEDFFRQQIDNEYKGGDIRKYSGFSYAFADDDPPDDMEFFFNEKMRRILMEQKPIREILGDEFAEEPSEVREYIGGSTWMQTLEKFLNETANEFNLGNGDNVLIRLTGGGSLMKCVQYKIIERFPKAQVDDGKEAVRAIGYGMARWGPDKVLAMDFEKKYRQFIERTEIDDDGDEMRVLYKELVESFLECVKDMLGDISEKEVEILVDCIKDWKDYRYTSQRIPDKFGEKFGNWCENTGAPRFSSNFADKIDGLKTKFNADFKRLVVDPLDLSKKLNDLVTLLPTNDGSFVTISEELARIGFQAITEIIVEHYKNGEVPKKILDLFNNDDQPGFFGSIFGSSDPRGDFLNENGEAINGWIAKETEATGMLCYQCFCEYEMPLQDNFKSTMMRFFIAEAEAYLEGLMEPRKKAILGKLVLEEILLEEE